MEEKILSKTVRENAKSTPSERCLWKILKAIERNSVSLKNFKRILEDGHGGTFYTVDNKITGKSVEMFLQVRTSRDWDNVAINNSSIEHMKNSKEPIIIFYADDRKQRENGEFEFYGANYFHNLKTFMPKSFGKCYPEKEFFPDNQWEYMLKTEAELRNQTHELLINDAIEHLKDKIQVVMRNAAFDEEDRKKIVRAAFGSV